MQQPQVLSRALNTHNFRKDAQETGPGGRNNNASSILGKAQESLYNAKSGIRNFFRGGEHGDEPETVPLVEQLEPPAPVAAGRARRGSVTTYTLNLPGTESQVEKEVRRLAGLGPEGGGAVCWPSASAEMAPSKATSFDEVQAMGGPDDDSSDDDEDYSYQGGNQLPSHGGSQHGNMGGQASHRSRAASNVNSGSHAIRRESSSGAGNIEEFHSMEFPEVSGANLGSPGALPDVMARPARMPFNAQARQQSRKQVQSTGQLTVNVNTGPTAAATGHLGLLRDRKASRQGTMDGYVSSPGPLSPSTPLGAAGGGGANSGGSTPVVSSVALGSVLRLPNLSPSTPGRTTSHHQLNIGNGPPQSSAALSNLSPSGGGGGTDSRPGTSGGRSGFNRAPYTATSDPVSDLNGSPGNSGQGGGGRWYQQDPQDVEEILAGGEEALARLMAAQGAGAGPDGGPSSSGAGGEAFHLPRLTEALPDRAAQSLNDLYKFQANLDSHLTKERQAMATGRVRRSSVLEDVVGSQQPRWQGTYNPDAQVSHGKVGSVDPNRRSELDKIHLTKIAKDQKGGAAAASSAVVARARRLSTVMA